MGSASPPLKPDAASAPATRCPADPTNPQNCRQRPENTNEQRRSERRSDQDMASREHHNSGGGGNGNGGHGFDFPSSGFGSGGRGHHQGQRGFMKPQQGRDYTKPRSFTSSPTQNRGAVRVSRPGRELYRAPGVWDDAPQLNRSAQEFSPLSPAPLTSSRSMDWGPGFEDQHDNISISRQRPSSLKKSTSLVSTTSPQSYLGSGTNHNPHLATATEITRLDVSGLGTFPPDVEATVKKAMEAPNRLGGRALMELVRTIFARVVEGQERAEPAARLCISIIEREKKETFLESLLNTCQEWYHERGELLRSSTSPPGRWPAFMAFLNEMYGLLKRRQLQLLTKYEGVPPKLVLLSLLAECCIVTLTGGLTLATVSEGECLFMVLTHIGRDLHQEAPGQMGLLLSCLRDSFLHTTAGPAVRKTLLQLIELQAAGWQLPAPAVMYYYPGHA